jgi:hypothetical protein
MDSLLSNGIPGGILPTTDGLEGFLAIVLPRNWLSLSFHKVFD